MEDARRLYPDFDVTRSWKLPNVPVLPGDENLGGYLRRIGFSEAQLQYTRRSFANAAGDSLPYISAKAALIDMTERTAGVGDFRVMDGYDSLAAHLAEGLNLCLGAAVRRIEWSPSGVRVTTDSATYDAERVVITLPLGVLQRGGIEFAPALPAEKQAAIEGLRMGAAIKLIYRFEEPMLPAGIMALYSAGVPPMWWSPSFGHEADVHVWTAFVTGDWARDLVALGEAGALDRGLKTLRTELGRDDLRPADARLVNWPGDPFTLGGYSVLPPGKSGAREALAAPVADRLYWAGEATAPQAWAATVHGAFASGQRVAMEILSHPHPPTPSPLHREGEKISGEGWRTA